MAEVRLRPWRPSDADRVAVMIDDEYLRPWSTIGTDLEAWIRREIAQERDPTRAVVYRVTIGSSVEWRCAFRSSPRKPSAARRCASRIRPPVN